MTQAQTVFSIQNVAEPDLAQIVATLFVMPALSQFIARVVADFATLNWPTSIL
jgi:hypothetical protein